MHRGPGPRLESGGSGSGCSHSPVFCPGVLARTWVGASRSLVSDSATPWTVAPQAPLSMGFSRQHHWSGLHALLQGVFPPGGEARVSSVSRTSGRVLDHERPLGSCPLNWVNCKPSFQEFVIPDPMCPPCALCLMHPIENSLPTLPRENFYEGQ